MEMAALFTPMERSKARCFHARPWWPANPSRAFKPYGFEGEKDARGDGVERVLRNPWTHPLKPDSP